MDMVSLYISWSFMVRVTALLYYCFPLPLGDPSVLSGMALPHVVLNLLLSYGSLVKPKRSPFDSGSGGEQESVEFMSELSVYFFLTDLKCIFSYD